MGSSENRKSAECWGKNDGLVYDGNRLLLMFWIFSRKLSNTGYFNFDFTKCIRSICILITRDLKKTGLSYQMMDQEDAKRKFAPIFSFGYVYLCYFREEAPNNGYLDEFCVDIAKESFDPMLDKLVTE